MRSPSPFSTFVSLFLVLSSPTADALRLPFHKRAVSGHGITVSSPFSSSTFAFGQAATDSEDVNNLQDIRYVTNITINNVQVQVALDTGSTDLWVIPTGGIGTFNDTGIQIDLRYGDGSYGTSGTIGVSPFEFGTYKIEKQAFMNAVQSDIGNLQQIGVFGLMGLSFDFITASPINQKIESLYGPDATWGRSVLQNIFQQNPTEPNFIAIDLSRTGDLEDTDGGSFTIGETLPKYANVTSTSKLAQYPTGGDRWTTLLDGLFVDGKSIDVVSTIAGVPAGSSQALLDTGDPNAILPVAMYDGIYSSIPGSALYDGPDGRIWVIPCSTTAHVEVVFGGVHYPFHPLDLSTISDPLTIDGKDYVACVSALKGIDRWGGDDYDISLGDSFLRNVYALFDFGDAAPDGTTKDPYIQLLSKIDPAKAISEVATIRGKTMATLPPEMDPSTLVGILMGTGTGTGTGDPTSAGPVAPTAASTDGPAPTSSDADGLSSANEGSSRTKSNSDVDLALGGSGGSDGIVTIDASLVKKYGLIAFCLLGANLLVGLVLIVLGVLACVRRGSTKRGLAATRAGAPVYVPVKSMDRDEGYSDSYQKGYSQ
ncbi:hypothetical protein GALMADRAFT_141158 [Galerina marginata CBS 339.88]|uniref:Peptidase A1 domain-containing protein n=1 Tax=Galerina marginata (strain CBS 339.88) TaxID=685588 RepID=A0A067SV62_GALM3|nr:hypothetical protein GALMADRAFT_141158 [Galerina marginata CBS 339.88]